MNDTHLSYSVGMPGPDDAKILLADGERAVLEEWSWQNSSSTKLGLRARIILGAAAGVSNAELARQFGTTRSTVRRWRKRFVEDRCEGLLDHPRSGRPRELDDAKIEALIVATLQASPPNGARWSTRSMASHLGLSQSTVMRVWHAFGLAPHKQESSAAAAPGQGFVDKVSDVVGLFLSPPERALAVSADKLTRIDAADLTQAAFSTAAPELRTQATLGHPANTAMHVYTTLDWMTKATISPPLEAPDRAREFLTFLSRVDSAVPEEFDIYLILHRMSTHRLPSVRRWLSAHSRINTHTMRTSSAWLNVVGLCFAELNRRGRQLGPNSADHPLRADIHGWVRHGARGSYLWTRPPE